MARIVVFTHSYDRFSKLRLAWPPLHHGYFLSCVLREAEALGHTWRVVRGPKRASGDVAILHVDTTIVEPAYLELGNDFPTALNFNTRDISKRMISDAGLNQGDAWSGQVIIKSNLNFAGFNEALYNRIARRRGKPAPYPTAAAPREYIVLPHIGDVPENIWDDESCVVEKFLPEQDDEGYAIRTWKFLGAHGTCMRHLSREPIIKAANTLTMTPVDVPTDLREKRRHLGFDYGKFDFVMYEGRAILLDANRTPGSPPRILAKDVARGFARGLDDMITRAKHGVVEAPLLQPS